MSPYLRTRPLKLADAKQLKESRAHTASSPRTPAPGLDCRVSPALNGDHAADVADVVLFGQIRGHLLIVHSQRRRSFDDHIHPRPPRLDRWRSSSSAIFTRPRVPPGEGNYHDAGMIILGYKICVVAIVAVPLTRAAAASRLQHRPVRGTANAMVPRKLSDKLVSFLIGGAWWACCLRRLRGVVGSAGWMIMDRRLQARAVGGWCTVAG